MVPTATTALVEGIFKIGYIYIYIFTVVFLLVLKFLQLHFLMIFGLECLKTSPCKIFYSFLLFLIFAIRLPDKFYSTTEVSIPSL